MFICAHKNPGKSEAQIWNKSGIAEKKLAKKKGKTNSLWGKKKDYMISVTTTCKSISCLN